MRVKVHFYSFFKDLAGTSVLEEELLPGATVDQLVKSLHTRFPKLAPFHNSTLIASGVDYVGRTHLLQDGEEISLFPPVQGG